MTALVDLPAQVSQIIDIRRLGGSELDPLLREETVDWDRELDWDFSKSADLVRKLADARRLGGAALLDGSDVGGYGYFGVDRHKGLIAGVYVRPRWRGGDAEAALLRCLLNSLRGVSGVRRIESQLMLVDAASAQALQRHERVQLFERLLMKREANTPLPPGRESGTPKFRLEPWDDGRFDVAAAGMSRAYAGHIDARINDEYGSFAGAQHLLRNLMQFPGCSTFHRAASYIGFHRTTGAAAGMVLASFVAEDVGHIAEICVTPEARGAGLGHELLLQSIAKLREQGAKRVTLAVTAANEEAVGLYRRFGFREARRFYAYVWEAN